MQRLRGSSILAAGILYLATAYFLWWQLPVLPRASWPWHPSFRYVDYWPERNLLLTAYHTAKGWHGPVEFRQADTGRVERTLLSEQEALKGVVRLAPDRRLLTWYDTGWLHVFDLEKEQKIAKFSTGVAGNAWRFSPDSRLLFYAWGSDSNPNGTAAPPGSNDGKFGGSPWLELDIVVWDTIARKERYRLSRQSFSAACSPDGRWLATCPHVKPLDIPHQDDRTVKLWAAATGRLAAELPEHDGRPVYVAFSPDGKTLLVGCMNLEFPHAFSDKPKWSLRLWNLETQTLLTQINDTWMGTFVAGKNCFWTSTWEDAWQQGKLQFWDAATGQLVRTVGPVENVPQNHNRQILVSPGGRFGVFQISRTVNPSAWQQWLARTLSWPSLALPQQEYSVLIHDLVTGADRMSFRYSASVPAAPLCAILFGPEKQTLITVGPDQVRVWALPLSRPWAHILSWPLLPMALWLLWRWRVLHKRQAIGS